MKKGMPWLVGALVAYGLFGCADSQTLAERCLSAYPPPKGGTAGDTAPIPPLHMLPVFEPSDTLPQIYSADSSTAWFRSLYYASFDEFRSDQEIRSFMLRFQARILGRIDTTGWYAVMIPDPGTDTSRFNLLQHCIGAKYAVYVRSVVSRSPLFLVGDSTATLPAD